MNWAWCAARAAVAAAAAAELATVVRCSAPPPPHLLSQPRSCYTLTVVAIWSGQSHPCPPLHCHDCRYCMDIAALLTCEEVKGHGQAVASKSPTHCIRHIGRL